MRRCEKGMELRVRRGRRKMLKETIRKDIFKEHNKIGFIHLTLLSGIKLG